ncbi:30S ribosomal protein S8 [candidate division MSBL1 archaeon SCGC-AAA261F19]|uniref:Small ribosomal subunit protein uS8 n=3 Tax=candidate division MSBL1 TaxID=215777 RepID=A0A133UYJ5_9EURY|nr:30S ribosomal protein S8 [candidate division MSBL1 archaeon SCGC-AAA261C02]KXB02811.1 30S ribosomal protein S8 [candidate division MSBL1 archaeon SCGC-AAA261D19]KXB03799.1 30S ribosomal protein S8 [candidate division MSBL1 archaeon SCGC-AAA261F19]
MSKDPLSDALSTIKNYEEIRKREAIVSPASKLIADVLSVMKENDFIGDFKLIDDGKSGKFQIKLIGNINDCGVIKPRFSVKSDEYEKWEKRFLPAAGYGTIAVSTPEGVMSHDRAKEKGLGGRLLAFVY